MQTNALWLLRTCLVLLSVQHAVAGLSRLQEYLSWKQVDFTWPSKQMRQAAMNSGLYVPENVLPLGIEVTSDRIFVTLPRWKPGIPATLATVHRYNVSSHSPPLEPYPSWMWHQPGNCEGLTSVFRLKVDSCNRLWVIDSGSVDISLGPKQMCPPKVMIFDLATDMLLRKYELPDSVVKNGSFFTNIEVEVLDNQCGMEAFAYIGDVWRFGLVVYSLAEDRSWRIEHEYFYPDPLACHMQIGDIDFRWTDGLFGLALSPPSRLSGDRTLFFHPLSSFREFSVPTSALRNYSMANSISGEFHAFPARGPFGEQSSGSSMADNGVLFYNLVTRSAVGCWNSRLPFRPEFQGVVDRDRKTLGFPNDLRVDRDQNVWVVTNRLERYLYKKLDGDEVNFRIMMASVKDAVRGSVCDPKSKPPPRRPTLSSLSGLLEAQFGCRLLYT